MITINKKSGIYGAVKIAYSIQQSTAEHTPHAQVLNGEMFTTDSKRALVTSCALEDGFYKIIKAGSDYLVSSIGAAASKIPLINRLRVVNGLLSHTTGAGLSADCIAGMIQQTRRQGEVCDKYFNSKWVSEFAAYAEGRNVEIYYSKPTYPIICQTDNLTWICMPAEG